MIIGIGTDIIEIQRVIKACEKKRFVERIFTEEEQKLIAEAPRKAAGNFAVKEAVSKVFGTGFRGFAPRDIEVYRDPLGAPALKLYGAAEAAAEKKGVKRWFVTISHTETVVTATVIGEG